MDTYKYTTDGKKVLVIGALNESETIVQEILVVDGKETPSGDNFIARVLLDAPAETWKEKKIRELDETFQKRRTRLERESAEMQRKLTSSREKARAMAASLIGVAENAQSESLKTLRNFIAGDIQFLACPSLHYPEIMSMDGDKIFQGNSSYNRNRIDGVKLVTLFGVSNGDLEYRLNDYKDGSGSWTKLIPCKTKEEAVKVMQEFLDEKSKKCLAGDNNMHIPVERWSKIEGVIIPEPLLAKNKATLIARVKLTIKNTKEALEKQEEELKRLKS